MSNLHCIYIHNVSCDCFLRQPWFLLEDSTIFTPTLIFVGGFQDFYANCDFLRLRLSSHCSFAAKGTQDAVKRKVWPLDDSCFHLIFRCKHLKRRIGDPNCSMNTRLFVETGSNAEAGDHTTLLDWEMWTEHTTSRIGLLFCPVFFDGPRMSKAFQIIDGTSIHPWTSMNPNIQNHPSIRCNIASRSILCKQILTWRERLFTRRRELRAKLLQLR